MKNFSHKVLVFFAVLCFILLASCASTPRTIEVHDVEYIPIRMNITDSVGLLFASRPAELPAFPKNAENENYPALVALAYKEFGEAWMDYSFLLEDYIEHLKSALAEPVDGI